MKRTLLFLAAMTFVGSIHAQLLYSISGKGLERPSYIIGTHHLIDASFASEIVGLEEALQETDQVYGEVVMAHMANPDSMAAIQALSFLPDGQNLRDILTTEQFTLLDRCFQEIIGAKLSSDQIFSTLGRMTPSGLSSYLTVMLYIQNHPGEVNIQNGIDSWFQAEAARQGKPVGGLESVAFQANLLMQSGSLEEQIKSLMCLVENIDLNLMLLNDLTEAYHKQDLEGVATAMDTEMDDGCAALPDGESEALLYMRNERWVKQMPSIMEQHPTFFAVGAAHLIGERGVLELLRQAGYTVEGIR